LSQFDETTERKASEHRHKTAEIELSPISCFKSGRNSAKDSLEILARAVDDMQAPLPLDENPKLTIGETLEIFSKRMMVGIKAIAQVKERGDWPLEEK
jgi:hypothetical protein